MKHNIYMYFIHIMYKIYSNTGSFRKVVQSGVRKDPIIIKSLQCQKRRVFLVDDAGAN